MPNSLGMDEFALFTLFDTHAIDFCNCTYLERINIGRSIFLNEGRIEMDETKTAPSEEQTQRTSQGNTRRINIAPFSRVVTSDPQRTDGCRSNRIQEFQTEDIRIETDLHSDSAGAFHIPVSSNGIGCIGLNWMENRRLKEISLCLDNLPVGYPLDLIEIQGWIGESAWQGEWKTFGGGLHFNGTRLFLSPTWLKDGAFPVETRKVRWIFPPCDKQLIASDFRAYTDSSCDVIDISIEPVQSMSDEVGSMDIYNGVIELDNGCETLHYPWILSEKTSLRVIHTKGGEFKWDRTVLRFRLSHMAFAVAVEDVIANGYVWAPFANVFISRKDSPLDKERYLDSIKERKTVLQKVRESPDQSLSQAIAITHNPIQDNGPMMLSLACDNAKFILSQDGSIEWRDYKLLFYPCENQNMATSMSLCGGWLPCPRIIGIRDGVEYRQSVFVTPHTPKKGDKPHLSWIRHNALGVARYAASNTSENVKSVSFAFEFHQLKNPSEVDIYFVSNGAVVCRGEYLVAYVVIRSESPLKLSISGDAIHVHGYLPAQGVGEVRIHLPSWDIAPEDYAGLNSDDNLYERFERYWGEILDTAMRIETPDRFLNNIIKASQVSCLIASRNEENGRFIAPWIASMAYGPLDSEANSIIRGMDAFGHTEFARRSLEFFIHRYTPQGFVTPEYTLMGTGWHLWTVGQHYSLHEDRKWLEENSSEFVRVGEWIIRQCEKTKSLHPNKEKPVEFGLAPPGVMADWNAFAYHFCLNGYYYAGVRAIGEALESISHPKAIEFTQFAKEYRENIHRAYRETQAISPVLPLRNGEWVMGYPSQAYCPGRVAEYFPGEDSNRTSAYDIELGAHQLVPQGVLDANEPDVIGMMEHMEDVAFLSDGWHDYPAWKSEEDWFNLGGFSKIQPYYTRNMEVYAVLDEVRPFIRSYFNTLASLLNTKNLTLWEHFHTVGAWNKTHETGYFLLYTRLMMIMERGEDLWIAPFVPSEWLRNGMVLSISNAHNRFGTTSYRIVSRLDEDRVEVSLENHFRKAPASVIVRLRHPDGIPISAVYLNDKPIRSFDNTRDIISASGKLEKIHITAIFQH